MPPPRLRLLLGLVPLALALLLVLVLPRAAVAAASGRWRWPVDARTLAGRFAYSPHRPFAVAQRRGIDIAVAPGAAVRSACSGRVSFAGPVPGGRGLGVSVRCGALVATHLGLASLAVRRGTRIAVGTRIGVVGAGGRLRLGARLRRSRFGYVDPLALLHDDGPAAAPQLGRAPRGPRLPVPLRPAARPGPVAVPVAGHGAHVPAAAWAGLVVLAAGVPLGGLVRRSRRRRAARV